MQASIQNGLLTLSVGVAITLPAQASAQTFQELYSFCPVWWGCGNGNGYDPQGALIQARDGSFYGTTMEGPDIAGCGTVFRVSVSGEFTTLASFHGTNGCWPYGALVEASDGNFYGTTLYGGWAGAGTIFGITPSGSLTSLVHFGIGVPGAYPLGGLTEGPDGKLYGACQAGTVFRMSLDGSFENMGGPGGFPAGALIRASDDKLYGTTYDGGTDGFGAVFSLTTNGTLAIIASFHGGPGSATWPLGKLLQASDGNYYGAAGGFLGTIFRVSPDGALTTFDRFDGYTGETPVGGLVQAADGNIYGTAYEGGPYPAHGTLFKLTPGLGCDDHTWNPCGNLAPLFWFGANASGLYPYAGLVQGSDGNLYGTTALGGTHGAGNIFRIIMPGHECELACPPNILVCNDSGQCGAIVNFAAPVATNCDGFVISCVPPSGSFFPVGTNIVVCTAVDIASGQLTNTCSFQVTVRDCEPPAIHSITAVPGSLWPPNHKMQPVTLRVSATDNCAGVHSKIISVTSNEARASDWEITGDLTVNLRAEPAGHDEGRVYDITVECADNSGNASRAVVHAPVRHER